MTERLHHIPPAVARHLGFYVYLYVDPADDSVFYVGKGKGGRALAHLSADEEKAIAQRIAEVKARGAEPRIEVLAHGMKTTDEAHRLEAAVIDLMGLPALTNKVRGHGAKYGRMPLEDLVALYTRRPAKITEPTILIRINKLYHYGMPAAELYDATRSAWRVGAQRDQVELAMAVFEGVIREVYRVSAWLPAGSTFAHQHKGRCVERPGRWEFVGVVAEDEVRARYVNRYVGDRFPQGAQNPVAYVAV